MGHLNIVNDETLEDIFENGCISIGANLGIRYIKTTADLFSDALTVRKGDWFFPWITGNGAGFQYAFKASDTAFFAKGDPYPIKIPLEPNGIKFDFLPESKAVDLWRKKLLWNLIGKKSLGRGKGITHQTHMEDEALLSLLKNESNSEKKINIEKANFSNYERITINPSQRTNNISHIMDLPEDERLSNIDLSDIKWAKDNGQFIKEKALEAWFSENIDKDYTNSFKNLAFKKDWEIIWFGNYLPFGVQGGNIDFVVIQSNDFQKIINVIELKVRGQSNNEFLGAAEQANNYSKYIEKALNAYEVKKTTINPIVLTADHSPRGSISKDKENIPKWVMYNIKENGDLNFKLYDPFS